MCLVTQILTAFWYACICFLCISSTFSCCATNAAECKLPQRNVLGRYSLSIGELYVSYFPPQEQEKWHSHVAGTCWPQRITHPFRGCVVTRAGAGIPRDQHQSCNATIPKLTGTAGVARTCFLLLVEPERSLWTGRRTCSGRCRSISVQGRACMVNLLGHQIRLQSADCLHSPLQGQLSDPAEFFKSSGGLYPFNHQAA